ncbi:MAG: hypothetical protein AAF802_01800 [Planctomycetota bacterium]
MSSHSIEASAIEQESGTFTGAIAYSGGALDLPQFDHPVYVECSGITLQSDPVPVLYEHDSRRPVGHGTTEISNKIVIDGRLSHVNEDTRRIRAAASNEFQWQLSIGAKLTQKPEFVPGNRTAQVNGVSVSGPCYVARSAILREVSFTPLGRDTGGATVHNIAASEGSNPMNEFEKWVTETLGLDLSTMSDDAVTSLRSTYEAAMEENDDVEAGSGDVEAGSGEEVTASASTAGRQAITSSVASEIIRETRRVAIAENRRISSINDINASYSGIPTTTRQPLYEQAIEGSITAEGFELAMMRQQRETPQSSGTACPGAQRFRNPIAVEAGLLLSNGMSQDDIAASMADDYSPSEIETAIDQASHADMRRVRWSDVVFACFDAAGMTPPSRRFDENVLRQAWEISASASSTVDLSSILEGTVNRHLMDAYNDNLDIVDEICGSLPAPDFKENEAVRMTAAGTLERVSKDDDITHMSLSEESTKLKVHNHSKLLTLSEEDQLSDDLGAFLQLARMFSRAGAQSVTIAVIEALTGAPSVAGAGNASTFFRGAKFRNSQPNRFAALAALGIGTLDEAVEMLENQTDSEGLPVQVTGNVLLTTTKNKSMAKRLYTSSNVAGGTKDDNPQDNPHIGLFKPVSSPHLGMAQFNPSGAANIKDQWYLVAKESDDIAPLMIAYLANRGRAPRVRTFEKAERIGVTLRPQLAFAVALHDARCIVASK